MGKWKKARPKVRHKKDVLDEWEVADIDRDEQKAGLIRREKRWKMMELAQKYQQELEKKAIDEAEHMNRPRNQLLTPLQEAWLRCDYLLFNIMEKNAYAFMEYQRKNDPEIYKKLYRKFMSKNMMEHAQYYVDYFARGNKAPKLVMIGDVVKEYKKLKGIKSNIKIIHKGEDEREL